MRLSDGREPIVADCLKCMTPESSAKVGVELADALHDGRYQVRDRMPTKI